MTFDPSKLPAAPLKIKNHTDVITSDAEDPFTVAKCWSSTFAPSLEISTNFADFIALARNAFDVMMRRGWNPTAIPGGGWQVEDISEQRMSLGTDSWPDPFTVLVAADEWLKAHEAAALAKVKP